MGWLTEDEQQQLRQKRVAIAGMGGVGGIHLLTLARLGIEKFTIADFDVFELANFNRQVGASVSQLNRPKILVLEEMVKDINPGCDLRIYDNGVASRNIADFLSEADLYVDGLDFFAFDAREQVFKHCEQHRIPAITVAPLGMSAALINFTPDGISFEDYFKLKGLDDLGKAIHFLVGLAPNLLHRQYLADKSRVDLRARKGPSTIMACQLCAGIAATEALKILLNRGKIWTAPHGIQYDAYRQKLAHTWRPMGNSHFLNRLAIALAKRYLGL